jgi:hypothetical protein
VAGADGDLVTGRLPDAGGRLLLTDAFVDSLPGTPAGEAVMLGDVEAYRYDDLQARGVDRPLRLFVAPTDRGVVGIACLATRPAFMAACDRAAATLELDGAEAFPLGPDAGFGRRLDAALQPLDARRPLLQRDLREARTRRAQAAAAEALEREHGAARERLGAAPANPTVRAAGREVAASLAALATAYDRLSDAAARGRGAAYRRAARSVRTADVRLSRALGDVERLGYGEAAT